MQIVKQRSRGFTLLELLTVIAIIAILAAIIIPTTGAVRNSAKRAKTKVLFSQWASAMEQFKQEYGYYPRVDNGTHTIQTRYFAGALSGKAPDGTDVTTAELCGNKRKIAFYTFTEGDFTTGDTPSLQDAFGNTDIVVLYDTDGDGRITSADGAVQGVTGQSGTLTPEAEDLSLSSTSGVSAGVIFYSAGKGETSGDIVYSWK